MLCDWCQRAALTEIRRRHELPPTWMRDDAGEWLLTFAIDTGKQYPHLCEQGVPCYCQCRQRDLFAAGQGRAQ